MQTMPIATAERPTLFRSPPPAVVQQATVVAPPAAPPVSHTEAPAPAVQDTNVSERPINGGTPTYPPRMIQSGREGSVDVECDVDTDGKTSNCTVLSSSGGSAFADSALEFVKTKVYKPATHNGQAMKVRHKWTIAFKLQ